MGSECFRPQPIPWRTPSEFGSIRLAKEILGQRTLVGGSTNFGVVRVHIWANIIFELLINCLGGRFVNEESLPTTCKESGLTIDDANAAKILRDLLLNGPLTKRQLGDSGQAYLLCAVPA